MGIKNKFVYSVLISLGFISNSSISVTHAAAYEKGQFSIKPINWTIARFNPGGLIYQDSRIKTVGTSVTNFQPVFINSAEQIYRGPVKFGFSEGDRNGYAYAIEAGYVFINDYELFLRVGYCGEQPKNRFIIGDRSIAFHKRGNWGTALGLRYYFDFQSAWRPFIAGAAGVVWSTDTQANIWAHNPRSTFNYRLDTYLGKYKMLNSRVLFNFELSTGTDYAFNDHLMLSASVALRYSPRAGSHTVNTPAAQANSPAGPGLVPARALTYSDNRQQWYIPITLALKITL